MDDLTFDKLRRKVELLRRAIALAKTSEDTEISDHRHVKRWPKDCCDAPYLFFLVYELGFRGRIRKFVADVSHYGKPFEKHVWMQVDGVTVDITADQFPDIEEQAIVSRSSPWHDSLKLIEENKDWALGGDDAYYAFFTHPNPSLDSYWLYENGLGGPWLSGIAAGEPPLIS